MQGAEERRLKHISNTPQGEAIDGNAADDALMVDQGIHSSLTEALKSKHNSLILHNRMTRFMQEQLP